jgi:hypothetical protein
MRESSQGQQKPQRGLQTKVQGQQKKSLGWYKGKSSPETMVFTMKYGAFLYISW